MGTATLTAPEQVTDTFPINGTDFIEFYVGNAKQAAHFYRNVFGYKILGYRGPETGTRDRASYILEQGKVRLLLTTALRPDSDIASHVHKHGDGVKDIALWVDDARKAFRLAVERGAKPAYDPKALVDEQGEVVIAAIHTYGETIHSLVERRNYKGPFMPGFVPFAGRGQADDVGLQYIDHCVGNVELGAMNKWVKYYADVLGFSQLISFDDKTISTEYSALMSKVVANGNGRIKFPLNEPAKGKKKSHTGRAQRALAPATSRRCSRRSSANRTFAETSSHADLSHTRTNPSQEAYRLSKTRWRDLRRGAGRS